MKKFNITLLSFLMLTVFILAGCGKKDVEEEPDTTKPVITLTKPLSGDVLQRGGAILLSGSLTDNKELKSLTASVTYTGTKSVSVVEKEWTPEDAVISVSGVEFPLSDRTVFTIPTDIFTGSHTMTLKLLDNAGNSSVTSVEITIE